MNPAKRRQSALNDMDIGRLNVDKLFEIVSKNVGERAATILKDNGVNGQGLLQLNDQEAKKRSFPS